MHETADSSKAITGRAPWAVLLLQQQQLQTVSGGGRQEEEVRACAHCRLDCSSGNHGQLKLWILVVYGCHYCSPTMDFFSNTVMQGRQSEGHAIMAANAVNKTYRFQIIVSYV